VLKFRVGRALAAAGRFDRAIERFRQALAIDRDEAAIDLELGQALLVSKRSDQAIPHLQRAYAARFRADVSGPWLARALAASKRNAEAVAVIRALGDDMAASRPETAFELGTLALELASAEQAERWSRIAVAGAPNHAEAHEKLGVARLLLNRPRDAGMPSGHWRRPVGSIRRARALASTLPLLTRRSAACTRQSRAQRRRCGWIRASRVRPTSCARSAHVAEPTARCAPRSAAPRGRHDRKQRTPPG
jgi:tetratricopeptide (TPR) repeat protein